MRRPSYSEVMRLTYLLYEDEELREQKAFLACASKGYREGPSTRRGGSPTLGVFHLFPDTRPLSRLR